MDKLDKILEIVQKIEVTQATLSISIDTIDERGCKAGVDREDKLKRDIDTSHRAIHGRINKMYYWLVGGIAGGQAVITYIKKLIA